MQSCNDGRGDTVNASIHQLDLHSVCLECAVLFHSLSHTNAIHRRIVIERVCTHISLDTVVEMKIRWIKMKQQKKKKSSTKKRNKTKSNNRIERKGSTPKRTKETWAISYAGLVNATDRFNLVRQKRAIEYQCSVTMNLRLIPFLPYSHRTNF